MNDPLFRGTNAPLSSEDEIEITRNLAEAYRQSQNNENRPEFRRIAKEVQRQLEKIAQINTPEENRSL